MRWLPIIVFFIYVYIEVSVFVAVANVIGVLFALILIVFTCFCGLVLIRQQGLRTIMQIQQKMAIGENPAQELIKNVSIFFAGILLLVPGFVTDVIGLILLLPPVQILLVTKLLPKFKFSFMGSVYNKKSSGNTYDGEYTRKDDDNKRIH